MYVNSYVFLPVAGGKDINLGVVIYIEPFFRLILLSSFQISLTEPV